jgi:hypothetical protein
LRLFEHRVLRRIFGPTREEVVGGWRRLHNEELHNLYDSPNIIRVIKARMRKGRNAFKILGRKPEGRRPPLGSYKHRWEDSIRMDLRE